MADALHTDNHPLVSVVIPCFNHAMYLPKAIESSQRQTYRNIEIIVVDDGSTDNTREVAERYTGLRYVYQHNQGLSAARNAGVKSSRGKCIVFLDADDWLYPKGIETNVKYLLQHKEAAFVSGVYDAVYVEENNILESGQPVESEHYRRLLQCNYIGMIAAVLFQRWVFQEFSYNVLLKNCEDYDLYLRIARKYPVYHHLNKIAAYRLHSSNMSANIPLMLTGVLHVLKQQRSNLKTEQEKQALRKGYSIWKKYYCKELHRKLLSTHAAASGTELYMLFKYKPKLCFKYIINYSAQEMKTTVKRFIPSFGLRLLHKMGLYRKYIPAVGAVDFGDFNRRKPFSKEFGYDRGGPIDRYYIEKFLGNECAHIKGRVLEIGDNEYTVKFGGDKITRSDILHVNDSNPAATFIGDISNAPHLPDSLFDCIVLTQTLHLIYDFKGAIRTCYRILKPGGVLLLTVPGITPIDQGEWKETWYWSFTDKVMQRLMSEIFSEGTVDVTPYGNVLAAGAFLYGMGLTEIPKLKLDYNDPHYQVIITVKAIK